MINSIEFINYSHLVVIILSSEYIYIMFINTALLSQLLV